MPATTSTPALTGIANGTLAITSAAVQAGTASLPVFVGAVNPAVPGIYITASPDFVGTFTLLRRQSGYQAGATAAGQSVLRGDQMFLQLASPAPLATLSGMDSVTLTLTGYASGSIVLSVVQ